MSAGDRELLIEIGCEEIPASWLGPLIGALGGALERRLREARLVPDAPVDTYGTPRRLVAHVAQLADRQSDLEELVSGPPVSAAFTAAGTPTPAAAGFARKHGVEVSALERTTTPKGEYLAFRRHERGRPAADVLPEVLGLLLRDLPFPKQMRWDAYLDDGRGELLFGRPIRWLLVLFGGRVVPFTILRSPLAQSARVQEVTSGGYTYGHRFRAGSGRAGRAVRVRSFAEYRSRLAEHFVVLERAQRHERLAAELDAQARRLGGRVGGGLTGSTLLDEVADLVEYPAVVAGSFPDEFLRLPEEVLTTTMIHHQHYFPVVDAEETLLPVFLAVTNIEVDEPHRIAVNAERVLVARLRDARFFWESDRGRPLESRLERLDTLQFHRTLGSYRAKADRLERLAAWIVTSVFERPALADAARRAGRLAKVDLTTDMVREFTELQGTMGGIYAREEGAPDEVWRAIYHHYLPVAPEPGAPPAAEQLGRAAATWAAVSLADKLDSIVGLFSAGERPTGTRDPFGMRRQLQGALRVLVELPELTGLAPTVQWQTLVAEASSALAVDPAPFAADLQSFAADRLRHLFSLRGFRAEEIEAALFSLDPPAAPLTARRRLEALREHRGSTEFQALAALFKRVRNLAREISPEPQASYPDGFDRGRLSDPAERQLLAAYDAVAPRIRAATAAGDYRSAVSLAAGLRPQVDEFFARVFVMADDDQLRRARLMLLVHLRDLVLEVGDIAHLSTDVPATAAERAG